MLKFNGLHHLPQHAVSKKYYRDGIPVSEFKCPVRLIRQLLDRGWRQDYCPVIAVSSAARGLEIIGLRRRDAPEARASP